ncbi:MAG: hypothetical protein RLZZ144_744 [Pseudomonadota bacterium]
MNIQARKQALRQSIIGARNAMSVTERAQASQQIAAKIAQLTAYRDAKCVLAYLNFGAEFSAELFAQQVLQDGKTLYLPKVNSATKELELYRITDLSQQIAPGLWNIPEPLIDRCEELKSFAEVDFVLLPGVAFTESGARLGYGGGFYDKLLARFTHQPTLVAAGFSCQVVPDIPLERTDRAVDWLITEHKTICCNLGRE